MGNFFQKFNLIILWNAMCLKNADFLHIAYIFVNIFIFFVWETARYVKKCEEKTENKLFGFDINFLHF